MAHKKSQMNGIPRQVSLSKRRSGTLNKACEVCTLCAVETALVVFSRDDNAFSTCHPCFEAIMKKLANPEDPDSGFAQHMAEHEANIHELKKQYAHALQELETEKKRGEELKLMRKAQGMPLWDKPIEELNLNELEELRAFLEQAKRNLVKQLERLSSVPSSNPSVSTAACSAEAIDPAVDNLKGISADTDGHDVCLKDQLP